MLFHNIVRRVLLPQHFGIRNISTAQVGNAEAGANTKGNAANPKSVAADDADIDAALQIEASLFENSSLQHRPVIMNKELLRGKPAKPATAPARAQKPAQPPPQRQLKIIDDAELGLQFARLNRNDPLLSSLLTTVRSRKLRDKQRQIIVEGRRLVREALDCQLRMHTLIFSQTEQLRQLKKQVAQAQSATQSKIYQVAQHDLKTWSTLTTPSGLMGIFERPSAEGIEQRQSATQAAPITVVCDNIREPNNLGSIIRTCAAIPCLQVIVTRGCCDPWESKALRGGCGGQFRLPIRDDVDWAQLPFFIPPQSADDCCVFIAENNIEKAGRGGDDSRRHCVVDFTQLGRTGAHNVVIIGGESHGVSREAYNFMETVGSSRGKCLHIPLAEGVDSLNVASALTLILYELRRHCMPQSEAHNV